MDKKFIIANWKMLPNTLAEAEELLDAVDGHLETLGEERQFSLVFCPPFVFLEESAKILQSSHLLHQAELGAQDIAPEDKAALTGEVSGAMLGELGVTYVIIGHSERRWKLGETDEVTNKKLKTALAHELVPVVCLGERERSGHPSDQSGRAGWQDALRTQMENTLAGLTGAQIARCMIAYEPVWAISTNPGARPDTPDSALQSIAVLKEFLLEGMHLSSADMPLFLYGGSVNSGNIEDFLKPEEISGVLVGGASVKKDEFTHMLSLAAQLK